MPSRHFPDTFKGCRYRSTTRPFSISPPGRRACRRAYCSPTGPCSGISLGVQIGFDFFPQPGDRMWSPADWALARGADGCAGLGLVPRRPGAATFRAARFDAEQACAMMGKHGITTALLMPTMLRLMRQVPGPVATLRPQAAGDPLGRGIGRQRVARLGEDGARGADQRAVRPDRVQSRDWQQRETDADQAPG